MNDEVPVGWLWNCHPDPVHWLRVWELHDSEFDWFYCWSRDSLSANATSTSV